MKLLITGFLLLFSFIAYADDITPLAALPIPQQLTLPTKILTLKDAILLALRTNPNVRSAEIKRIADKFALEVAHNKYQPQFAIQGSAIFQSGSRPQYLAAPTATWLTPLGTQVQVNYDSTVNLSGSGSSIFGGSAVTATITQPLLRGFGPAVTLAPLQLAKDTEQVNRLNLKNVVMTAITQVIQSYYQLVQAYNNLIVDQLALKNSLATLQQYKIRIKAGQAAPLSIAPQESQVATQELTVTQDKNNIEQAYQGLLTTLGLDPNSKLTIEKAITIKTVTTPSLKASTQRALENNVAYQQSLYTLKQDEINVLLAKDQQKWQLNLQASKTIALSQGSSNNVIPVGTNTLPGNDSVDLNLNIPINNKAQQQVLVDAKVALDQQKIMVDELRRQLEANVMYALQSLNFQVQQIKQAENAVQYADQAFEAEQKKLEYGRSTVLNVTQLRSALTSAKLSLIQQQIGYVNTLSQFEQLLGDSLDKWNVQVIY
jgi:outer membrane protein